MGSSFGIVKQWVVRVVALACLAGTSPVAFAQMTTATFSLENVWLLPDISHPREDAQKMTGTFDWTYNVGDFENGSGEFTQLSIPWFNPAINELNITVDLTSIEFTLKGSFHDLGIDITLFLLDPLSPDRPANVDTVRSKFTVEQGISRQGHVISGSVDPVFDLGLVVSGTCPSGVQLTIKNITPNGKVALLYSTSRGSLVIPNRFVCAGTTLGLKNKVILGKVLTADANGRAILNTRVPGSVCGNLFLQALDLTSCGTSNVELLQ